MSPELLIARAGVAIALFMRHNETTCYLCYEDGDVHAYPIKAASVKPTPCLVITKNQQKNGLTSSQWYSIGCTLLREIKTETQK